MTVSIDGTEFTIDDFNNSLTEEAQLGEVGRRLDLRAQVNGGTLILSVSNWDWQNPPEDGILIKNYTVNEFDPDASTSECKDFPNYSLCDGGLGTYLAGGGESYLSEGFEPSGPAEIVITENDPDERTVSGTFEFETAGFINGEVIRFKGTFTDLKYRVF